MSPQVKFKWKRLKFRVMDFFHLNKYSLFSCMFYGPTLVSQYLTVFKKVLHFSPKIYEPFYFMFLQATPFRISIVSPAHLLHCELATGTICPQMKGAQVEANSEGK